jgi:hypothetical protein
VRLFVLFKIIQFATNEGAHSGAGAVAEGEPPSVWRFCKIAQLAHLTDYQQQANYAEKYFRFFRHFVQRNGHFLRLYNKARKQKRKKILTKTNSRK